MSGLVLKSLFKSSIMLIMLNYIYIYPKRYEYRFKICVLFSPWRGEMTMNSELLRGVSTKLGGKEDINFT